MPVAGLPAALETLLTSLLTTEALTSWKVDGEGGNTVVVLRFMHSDGRPLLTSTMGGFWRRKTPAQRRRDQQRAENHRRKGEQRQNDHFSTLNTGDIDVANSSVVAPDVARDSRASARPSYDATKALTFDPTSCRSDNIAKASSSIPDVPAQASFVPHVNTETIETASASPISSNREATLEDFENFRFDLGQKFKEMMKDCFDSCRGGGGAPTSEKESGGAEKGTDRTLSLRSSSADRMEDRGPVRNAILQPSSTEARGIYGHPGRPRSAVPRRHRVAREPGRPPPRQLLSRKAREK